MIKHSIWRILGKRSNCLEVLKSDRSRGAWSARARSRPRCRRGPARSHSCCSPDDDLYDDEMNVSLMPRRTAICFEKCEHVIDRSFYWIEDAFWNETHKTGMTCAASDGAGRRLHRRGEEASQYWRHWKIGLYVSYSFHKGFI